MVKEINDSSFENEVINSKSVSVIDFWAPWCGPCRMLAPVMEEVEAELAGKANFVKINVDENPVVSNTYRVSNIPTLLVFKNGSVVSSLVGFRPKQAIVDAIKKCL